MNYFGYQQGLLFFMISEPNMSSNFHQAIYGWILNSKGFPYSLITFETEFGRRNYDRSKLEASHEQ